MHPDQIGPYQIDRKIGSGGMGNVYHGVHQQSGQEAAVKVLAASMAREDGFVQRFSREIQALGQLKSKHIVTLFDDGETPDGGYYYAMEFVDGETLTSLISRQKKLPWSQVIELSLQIAAALKAAHDTGIVHRDLKPSNLMLTRDGQIKLTDFGVAHVFATTRLTRTGGVVGTAEYMSPEQARGQRATKRSDLYSLGAVMYVMLAGRPPFTGKLASEVLHQHQFAQFDKPSHYVPELPRLLEDIVCTLLEKKPENRFPDALVVIRKLENARNRIEFQLQSESETQTSQDRLSAHTAALATDRTQGARSDARDHRGEATMIRDQIRDQIAAQLHKGPLARFFDNTLVLILLFAGVIFLGWYLLQTSVPQPAEQYAQAERIMQAPPNASWIRARNELLEPLLKTNALPEHREQMESWVQQADQFEFCRGLKLTAASDASQQGEMQRLVRQAFERHAAGEIVEAQRQLQAVHTLIQNRQDYSYLSEFVKTTLENWSDQQNDVARKAIVNSVLEQANAMVAAGEIPQAMNILRAASLLYQADPAVQEEIESLNRRLQELTSTESFE